MSINNVVAFQGWNSSNRAWNTSTWNGDVAYTVTATGQIGSAASVVNIGVAPTGVAGTSALGNIFSTNTAVTATGNIGAVTLSIGANVSVTGVSATASVDSSAVGITGFANISVTGVSATGQIGAGTGEVFPVWGQIIPSQTPNFSAISPSQTPSWENIAA